MKTIIRNEIAAIDAQSSMRLNKVAANYRRDVLLPLCKEHGLTFRSWNGRIDFYSRKGRGPVSIITSAEEASAENLGFLAEAFAVLSLECRRIDVGGRNDVLGYHVDDITEADISARGDRS